MAKAKRVTDEMFTAASTALADYVPAETIKAGKLYPDVKELRSVSCTVRGCWVCGGVGVGEGWSGVGRVCGVFVR